MKLCVDDQSLITCVHRLASRVGVGDGQCIRAAPRGEAAPDVLPGIMSQARPVDRLQPGHRFPDRVVRHFPMDNQVAEQCGPRTGEWRRC